jgi:phosphatidylserine/phosphatidylglycerophosphate/cardiolipin synthase-like enzyme
MIADGHAPGKGRLLVMDFNGAPSYFNATRGFGVVSTDALDVAEAQAVFDADWKYELPATYASKHLFWSPNGVGYVPPSTGAARVLGLLASARASLDVYALLIDWPPFADGLAAAAQRGVAVRVLTNCWQASTPPYAPDCARRPVGGFTHKYLTQLLAAGVQVRAGPQSSGLFVHTKTIVRDAGGDKGDALATVSSENPGDYVSMSSERELGIFVATPDAVATIAATFNADWSSATPVTA